MPLVTILVVILVTGVLLWLIQAYVPMGQPVKHIFTAIVVIVLVLWILQSFGLLTPFTTVRVR